jgi:hypothetical protein
MPITPELAAERLTRGAAASDAAVRALAQAAWAALRRRTPPHTVARLPDADLGALAQAVMRRRNAAAEALGGMPPPMADRPPDVDRIALAQAAARTADAAAQGAGAAEAQAGMPPQIAERLPEDDPAAPARAARLAGAFIVVAAALPPDDRIAWAQHAPPEAPAHGDALAARPARAQRDAAAAPLRAILEERLIPPDAPPPPSPPCDGRRQGRGERRRMPRSYS